MKKKTILLLLLLSSLSFNTYAQDANKLTIEDQLKETIDKSSTYQNFKLIKMSDLALLQRNIRDSLTVLKTTIVDSQKLILEQEAIIRSNTQNIEAQAQEIEQIQKDKDSINFLWMPTEKSKYNFIMWSLVAVLIFFGLFLYYKFKKSHIDTSDALKRLEETEEELENLRKRSLEREQKVRRELQDEINKNRNKSAK